MNFCRKTSFVNLESKPFKKYFQGSHIGCQTQWKADIVQARDFRPVVDLPGRFCEKYTASLLPIKHAFWRYFAKVGVRMKKRIDHSQTPY